MNQEQKYLHIFKEIKNEIAFNQSDFVQFCIEWDAACKRIKNASKRRRAKNGRRK